MKTACKDEKRKVDAGHDLTREGIKAGERAMTEEETWRHYLETGSPRDREELILQNARLVKSCANAMRRRVPPSIDYADLFGYGLLGLIDAVGRFDPSYERDFSIYARQRINGSIVDGIRKEAGIPRAVYAKWKRVTRAEEELTGQLRREPRREEVAAFLGVDDAQYDRMLEEINSWRLLSLDEMVSRGDWDGAGSLLEFLVDEKAVDPGARLEDELRDAGVRQAVRDLPWRYRITLELYYFQEFSMKEIAEVMSVSESRASQMHCQALSRLRNRMNGPPPC